MTKKLKINTLLFILGVTLLSVSAYDIPSNPVSQIDGQYIINQVGGTPLSNPITVSVTSPDIRIQGCNQIWSTFTYDAQTQAVGFGQFGSTRIGCPNNDDNLVTNTLRNARRALIQGNDLVFYDARNAEILRFNAQSTFNNVAGNQQPSIDQQLGFNDQQNFNNEQGFDDQQNFNDQQSFSPFFDQQFPSPIVPNSAFPSASSVIAPPLPTTLPLNSAQSTILNGQYNLAIPPLQLSMQNNAYRFSGCNSHTIPYARNADGSVRFSQASSTRKACQRDNDRYYLRAFQLGRFLEANGNSFRVLDQNRRNLLDIAFKSTGNYLLSLPSVNLNVDDSTFTFQGCNINTLDYSLSNRNIRFGTPTSTLRFCLFNDYDRLIVDSLKIADTYQLTPQGMILNSRQITVTIALQRSLNPSTPIVTIPQYSGPVVVPSPIYSLVPNFNYQIPSISYSQISSVSLKGTYTFNSQSSDLATIFVTFDDQYLQFQGCNVNRVPYGAYSDGVFVLLQGGSSTLRACPIDQDSRYLDILRSINRFQATENGYNFYFDNQLIATAEKRVRNQIVTYGVINGGYSLQIQGIQITISGNNIQFSGCNQVSIPFRLRRDGYISFGGAISTKIGCERDTDPIYINAIISGKTLRQTVQGYSLLDANGVEVIRFLSYSGYSQYQSFNGRFTGKLPHQGIRLTISDGNFVLSGCNRHSFKFSLSDNGNLVFGAVSSTRAFCNNDIDNAFLYTLLRVQKLATVGSSLSFRNGQGEQIAKAINFDQNINPKTPLYVDPKSPVVHKTEFTIQPGTYRLSLLRTSIKPLRLVVNSDNSITLYGQCNNIYITYNGVSDGSISFIPRTSNLRSCQTDYDDLFVKAFQQTARFQSMKGMYTLIDAKGKSILQLDFDASASLSISSNPVTQPIPTDSQTFTSLKGRYRFRLPSVNFEVQDGLFAFKGKCGTHRIPCSYKNNNIFFGRPISTLNGCQNNYDKYFLNLVPQILTARRDARSNNLNFFNQRLQSLFSANQQAQNSRESQIIPGLASGSYQAQLPNIDLQFDDSNIFFNGCRRSGFGYKASNNGGFNVLGGGQPCSNNYFEIFSNAFQGASRYSRIDGGFVIQDKDGVERGRCTTI